MSRERKIRVLYSTHMAPPYIDPAPWSEDQIVCGPNWPDGPRSLRTAEGVFDLADIRARLPAGWVPDVYIALVDAFRKCQPINIGALSCPKVALVADTHHGDQPIAAVLRHLKAERWDLIVGCFVKQHCHWFAESLSSPVLYGGPSLVARPYAGEPVTERIPAISFSGNAGKYHLRRRRLIDGMIAAELPVYAGSTPQDYAMGVWAKSQISFNCSLNGDANMRNFEILSAGGFLLTDRLSPEAGLDFEDGKHAVFYGGEAECYELARHYLRHPADCLKIGLAGREEYRARHATGLKMNQVLAAALDGDIHDSLKPARPESAPDPLTLGERIELYQLLQEDHRLHEKRRVTFVGARLATSALDAADLPRLDIALIAEPGSALPTLPAGHRAGKVRLADSPPPSDIIVTTGTTVLQFPRRPGEAEARVIAVSGSR